MAFIRPLTTTSLSSARQRPFGVSGSHEERKLVHFQTAAPLSPVEESAPVAGPSIDEHCLNSWTRLGVPAIIVRRLLTAYPHITMPTPAQRTFLLSILKGKDVFLKDYMGRGKTLAIAIAAVSHAYNHTRGHTSATKSSISTIILAPTFHLLHQIERDMLLLDPTYPHPDYPATLVEEGPRLYSILNRDAVADAPMPESANPILLGTPKDLDEQKQHLQLNNVDLVFIDEPDSILPSLPSRFLKGRDLWRHRINRHPPPLVYLLNDLLGIRMNLDDKGKLFDTDPSERNKVQTIWTSGTFDDALRNFIQDRNWARSTQLVDLDFTATATGRRIKLREQVAGLDGGEGVSEVRSGPMADLTGMEPDHFVLTVDLETGDMESLAQGLTSKISSNDNKPGRDGAIRPAILEALAMLHTISPPPIGTYALATPPEGTSIDEMTREFERMNIPTLNLTPALLQDLSILDELDTQAFPPILVARRSVVPGLHLPRLHTIYLVGGLDVSNLGPKAKMRERMIFYDILAGRLGRLGTESLSELNQGEVAKQRVISIVPRRSQEESAMSYLFFGGSEALGGGREGFGGIIQKRRLGEWDMADMEKQVRDSLQ